jgi:YVTN family beta-propeller protein
LRLANAPPWSFLSSYGNRLYVVNSGSGTVSVIDTNTNKVVGTPITVGNNPWGGGTGEAAPEREPLALSPPGATATAQSLRAAHRRRPAGLAGIQLLLPHATFAAAACCTAVGLIAPH